MRSRITKRSARSWAGVLLIGWSMAGCTLSGGASRLLVANSADNNLSVVDTRSDHEIRVIEVGKFPRTMAVSADRSLVAVSHAFDASVGFLDARTLEEEGARVPVGYYATDLVFDASRQELWVLSRGHGSLWRVDVPSRKIIGTATPLGREPGRMVLVDGRGLFVIREMPDGELIEVAPETGEIRRRVPMGRSPADIAWFEPRGTLLVATFTDDQILEIDPATLEVVETHDVPVGESIAIHPRKPLLYSVHNFLDIVTVYDLEARTTRAQIPIDSGGTDAVLSPDGSSLYVVNYFAGNVAHIDTESNEVKRRIAVGTSPVAAVLLP